MRILSDGFVTKQLDGGPCIAQATVPIEGGDNADILAARVLQEEHRIYPREANWFYEGRLALDAAGTPLKGELLTISGRTTAGAD